MTLALDKLPTPETDAILQAGLGWSRGLSQVFDELALKSRSLEQQRDYAVRLLEGSRFAVAKLYGADELAKIDAFLALLRPEESV